MKKHLEIEVKVAVGDADALRRRLRELRARVGKRLHEWNVLFDTPDGRLRRRDELLRLRVNRAAGERSTGAKQAAPLAGVVTFKGRSVGGARGRMAKYKVRQEDEFRVGNARTTAATLGAMGFVESFRYEKYRTEITLRGAPGALLFLDETPMGVFLEIEGRPAAIDRAARQLGIATSEYETRSYLALWAAECQRRGVAVGDFVFPRKKKSR